MPQKPLDIKAIAGIVADEEKKEKEKTVQKIRNKQWPTEPREYDTWFRLPSRFANCARGDDCIDPRMEKSKTGHTMVAMVNGSEICRFCFFGWRKSSCHMKEKAIVRHTMALYSALEDKSVVEEIDGDELYIYRGQVSKLYQSLSIPQSYYTEVFKQLDYQNCVVMLQRGGRNVDSVIVLLHPPDEGNFRETPAQGLTDAVRSANLLETVELHSKLIGGVHIADALRNIEERLQRLEEKHRGAKDSNKQQTKQGEKENG